MIGWHPTKLGKVGLTLGVFLVKVKNAIVPVKRDYSVDTYS